MTKNGDQTQTYRKFLNLVNVIHRLPRLNALQERVLNGLATTWANGTTITVLQAMDLTPDTSPARRFLKLLRTLRLIDLRQDGQDTRIKYVVATDSSMAYFANLGQCIDREIKGIRPSSYV